MKKNMQKAIIMIVMTVVFTLSIQRNNVEAATLNFAVETVIPENQIDKNKTYFDLRMEPEQEQILEIVLRNDTQADVRMQPKINTAFTNINGVVEYNGTDKEPDNTLQNRIEDLVKTEEEVTVPAQGEYVLQLQVTMPKEEFDGVIAGGIVLEEVKEEVDQTKTDTTSDETEDEQSMSIKNTYAYVVGITLNENDNPVQAELKLNDVTPAQLNARNVINANLQNVKPMYVNQMTVDATITEKDKTEVLYESHKESLQMAPHSNFDYPVSLNGEKMKGGTYTLKMRVTSKGEEWEFEKDFTIEKEVAKAFNQSDVTVEKANNWILVAIGIAIIILVLFIIIIVSQKRKMKKLQEAITQNESKK